jgi:hypothetical protein
MKTTKGEVDVTGSFCAARQSGGEAELAKDAWLSNLEVS